MGEKKRKALDRGCGSDLQIKPSQPVYVPVQCVMHHVLTCVLHIRNIPTIKRKELRQRVWF